jgi:hypothetical protein
VERPPQDLMTGWGRPPIYQASRPDHGLGIRATHNLAGKGKKGKRGGQRGDLQRGKRRETELSGSRENYEKSVF